MDSLSLNITSWDELLLNKPSYSSSNNSTPRSSRSTPRSNRSNEENLFKTEICKAWESGKECAFGAKCQYAHGIQELRGKDRHQKYKTTYCKGYHEEGICPYGSRCSFIHGEPFIPKETKKRLDCFKKLTIFDEESFDVYSSVLPQFKNMEII
jgi:hypothetical protein